MKIIKTTVYVSVVIILTVGYAYPQPIINSASPSWMHKSPAIIGGLNFGNKTPAAPLMWDDCEAALAGTDPSTTVKNEYSQVPYGEVLPAPSNPNVSSEYKTRYRAVNYAPVDSQVAGPHGYSTKYIAGGHQNTGIQGLVDNVALTVGTPGGFANRWFVHFYYRLNPEWPQPCGSQTNHKIFTFQSEMAAYGTGGNQYFYNDFDHHPCNGDSYVLMKAHPNRTVDQASGQNYSPDTTAPWGMWGAIRFGNPIRGWVKLTQEISNDQGFMFIRANNQMVWGGTGNPYFFTGSGNYNLGYSGIRSTTAGGFNRHDSSQPNNNNSFRFFDDLYIDSTLSRVMLCNNASYSASTVCEPQIPTAWDNSSIAVVVNQGALSKGTAYLFIFDAANNVNNVGFPISFDGAPLSTSPSPPTSLRLLQ
jgi:hypothetical protein